MRRIMTCLIAFFTTYCLFADTQIVDGIEWHYVVNHGEASVKNENDEQSAIPSSTAGAITVPSALGGFPVTGIGDRAFLGCSSLTAVTIPSGVTSIGWLVFCDCSRLATVSIPSSVSYIADWAFAGDCSALTGIEVSARNKHYSSQDGVLYDKAKTELIRCPAGRTGSSFVIPSGVTSVRDMAFSGCCGLTSVSIPSSVVKICYDAFYDCSNLTKVVIPSGVRDIGWGAFSFCGGLTSVAIPSSVTSIAENVFGQCNALRTVYVDSGDEERVRDLLVASESGIDFTRVEIVVWSGAFDGDVKHTYNGLVYDADDVMVGIAQIATAKVTKQGNVNVSGFVILEDGKKQTIKAKAGVIDNGSLRVDTSVGKIGDITLAIDGGGFSGSLGPMKLVSAPLDESCGIINATVKLQYFDAKTGKLKSKNIQMSGVTSGGEALGSLSLKGQQTKSFSAEIE